MTELRTFPGISPKAYEHPADRAATAALSSIPHVDTVINALLEWKYEREFRQLILGNSVLLGPQQLPRVWRMWQEVLVALDLPTDIEIYLSGSTEVNAMAVGSKKPIVVVNSGLVSLLDDAQLRGVLAHEAAHILSGHVRYNTALYMLLQFGGKNIPLIARLPIRAVELALLEWSRSSEFTCDRAAALVVGDPMVVCSLMLAFAGGVEANEMNVDAFVAQAAAYEGWESRIDRLRRFKHELGTTHGFPVQRVTELMRWVREGDWNRVMEGSYARRDDPVEVSREAEGAANFYTERFKSTFQTAAEEAAATGRTVSDRLRRAVGER